MDHIGACDDFGMLRMNLMRFPREPIIAQQHALKIVHLPVETFVRAVKFFADVHTQLYDDPRSGRSRTLLPARAADSMKSMH